MKMIKRSIWALSIFAFSMVFVQCKDNQQPVSGSSASDSSVAIQPGSRMPIAYINGDSLILKYDFAKDVSEELIRKEENARLDLNERANKLKKEQSEFERKYQNNAFLSPERAQQEYERLAKKQAELEQYAQRLSDENLREQQRLMAQVNDSIISFIREYNKDRKYEAIINSVGVLYIVPDYDITNEVVTLLNKRYDLSKSSLNKKK